MPADPETADRVGETLVSTFEATFAATVASIPLVGGAVSAFLVELELRRLKRAIEEMQNAIDTAAANRSITIEEFLDQIRVHPNVRGLIASAFETTRAAEDEHILYVARRILIDGLADDARVDQARLLMTTLRSLEPAHLRVLADIGDHVVAGSDGRGSLSCPMTVDEILTKWPEGRVVLPAVLATLQAAGLVEHGMFSVDRLVHPSDYAAVGGGLPKKLPTNNRNGYRLTLYGKRLRNFVETDWPL